MADLDGRSRGQIILVAAFALAVIFITLALIVNSAIFTQNLASRGETSGGDEALSHRAMVEASVGENVEIANRRNTTTTDLTTAVNRSIENISNQGERQQVRSGRLTNVSSVSYREGIRINQTDNSNFTNDDSKENYSVVGDIRRVDGGNGTRAFHINASQIDATETTSPFQVKVNRSGADGNLNSWRMQIYNDGSSGTVNITTRRNRSNDDSVERCAVDADSANQIDVTDGTINGKPCDALGTNESGANFHFGSGTGVGTSDKYDIYFQNADKITGNFSMVVNGTDSSLDTNSITDDSTDDPPYYKDALYDVTVDYTYETSGLYYKTEIRVAPGEPDA